MACSYCEHKGYIINSFFANNKENKVIKVCPKCNDVKAYSDYIKGVYGNSFKQKNSFFKEENSSEQQEAKVLKIKDFFKK